MLPSASQSNRAIIRNNTIECLCNLPSCPKTLPTASAFEKHGGMLPMLPMPMQLLTPMPTPMARTHALSIRQGMGYRKNAWDSIVVKRTGQTLRQALAELEVGSTPTATVSKRPPSDPKLAAAAAAKRAKDKEYKRKKQAERSHAAAAKARKVHRDYEHDSDGDHDGDDTDADTATSETDDDERPLETQPLLGIKRKREHPGLSAAQLGQPGAKRQCKMDGCNALARHCSKYCSDECGLVVARYWPQAPPRDCGSAARLLTRRHYIYQASVDSARRRKDRGSRTAAETTSRRGAQAGAAVPLGH